MKKWLLLAALLVAVSILSRRPHPARDVAELEPAEVVFLYINGDNLAIETDTGARGSGATLSDAAANMKDNASGEIFLDTAEFLLIHPDVPITDELFALLRPGCRVAFATASPDPETVSDYLTVHTPDMTLAKLRAGIARN